MRAAASMHIPVVAVYQTDVAGFALRYGLTAVSNAAWRRIRSIHERAEITLAPSPTAAHDLERHGIPRVPAGGCRGGQYRAAGHDFVLVVPGSRAGDEDLPWGRRVTLAGPPVPGSGGGASLVTDDGHDARRARPHPACATWARDMTYGEGSLPLAIAHRGGSALEQENSLAAFALASGLGLGYLETDVRVTSDSHLVCFHDETLDRVTLATGPVRSRSMRELRGLRINELEPIPTFDEALDAFPDQGFTVDIKDLAGLAPLVKSLQRSGVAERVGIAGARDGWLAQIRRDVPEVANR